MTKSPRHSPSVFAHCNRSNTGSGNSLGTGYKAAKWSNTVDNQSIQEQVPVEPQNNSLASAIAVPAKSNQTMTPPWMMLPVMKET